MPVDPRDNPLPTPWIRRAGCVIGVLATIAITSVVVALYPRLSNLKHEYVTPGAVAEVRKYVISHGGAWPKSWSDIPNSDLYRQHTKIRFDVKSVALIDDPDAIFGWITTVTERHYTYPNHRLEMEDLRDVILDELGAHRNLAEIITRGDSVDVELVRSLGETAKAGLVDISWNGEYSGLRTRAISAMAKLGDPEFIDTIARHLESEDLSVAVHSARVLSMFDTPLISKLLGESLSLRDQTLAGVTLRSIWKLSHTDAVDFLIDFSKMCDGDGSPAWTKIGQNAKRIHEILTRYHGNQTRQKLVVELLDPSAPAAEHEWVIARLEKDGETGFSEPLYRLFRRLGGTNLSVPRRRRVQILHLLAMHDVKITHAEAEFHELNCQRHSGEE